MRVCCFGFQPTKHDGVEHDYRDLLVSSTSAIPDEPVATTAEILTAAADTVKAADTAVEPCAVESMQQEAEPLAAADIPMQAAAVTAAGASNTAPAEQQVEQQGCPLCQGAAEPEPSLLLPAIKFFVHTVTDNHRLAIDQLISTVCQALGEGAVRWVMQSLAQLLPKLAAWDTNQTQGSIR